MHGRNRDFIRQICQTVELRVVSGPARGRDSPQGSSERLPFLSASLRQVRVIDDRIRGLPIDVAAEDFLPRLRATLATGHPGLSREDTAPVTFLAEEAFGDDGEQATSPLVSFLRYARVAA